MVGDVPGITFVAVVISVGDTAVVVRSVVECGSDETGAVVLPSSVVCDTLLSFAGFPVITDVAGSIPSLCRVLSDDAEPVEFDISLILTDCVALGCDDCVVSSGISVVVSPTVKTAVRQEHRNRVVSLMLPLQTCHLIIGI